MTLQSFLAIGFTALVITTTAAKADPVFDGSSANQLEDQATDQATTNDRLMIVNGNTGRVVYDDGRNDMFCVTRRVVVGYDYYGRPIRQRAMHCR